MKGKTMCTGMTSFNQPDGWISAKDRLPEDGKYVLCWYEYFRYAGYKAMQGIHQLNRDSMTADNTLDLIKAYTDTEDDIE